MKALEQNRDSVPTQGALVDNFNEVAAAVAAVLDSADEERALNLSAAAAHLNRGTQCFSEHDGAHARHSRAATEAAALAADAMTAMSTAQL